MSKISLSPDASGTGIFTIASPNSNTNRTLTLPDDTGTIVTNSGNQAGSFTTLNTSGQVVFNDAGADVDFRVEGDTDANLLFVDASADAVGIGTSSPNIYSLGAYKRLTISDSASSGYGILTVAGGSGGGGEIDFGNQTIRHAAIASVDGSSLNFYTNSTNSGTGISERMRIDSSGKVGIGGTPLGRLEVADVSQLTSPGAWASATLAMKQVGGFIGDYSQIVFGYHAGTQTFGSAYMGFLETNQGTNGYGDLVFGTRAVNTDTQPTERMRITAAGAIQASTSVFNGGGFGITQSLNTFNNNSANSIGQINSGFSIVYISQGNGVTGIPVFANAGGGVAWSASVFDPDAGAFVYGSGPTVNFATVGTGANSYQIVLDGNTAGVTIQRTAGSAAYDVVVKTIGF